MGIAKLVTDDTLQMFQVKSQRSQGQRLRSRA